MPRQKQELVIMRGVGPADNMRSPAAQLAAVMPLYGGVEL